MLLLSSSEEDERHSPYLRKEHIFKEGINTFKLQSKLKELPVATHECKQGFRRWTIEQSQITPQPSPERALQLQEPFRVNPN